MNAKYLILLCLVVVVVPAVIVNTPNGRKVDFSRLGPVAKDLVRLTGRVINRLLTFAQNRGLDVPTTVRTRVDDYNSKREREARQRSSDGWGAVRVTDPLLIDRCIEIWGPHPEGPQKLGDWRSALSCSVEEANEWRTISPDLQRWVQWKNAGLSPSDASGWLSSRNVTPQEAQEWKLRGFDSEIASAWKLMGYSPENAVLPSFGAILDPQTAIQLRHDIEIFNINPQLLNLQEWLDAGFTHATLSSIPGWIKFGFSAKDAAIWGNQPAICAEWRDHEFTPDQMRTWKQISTEISASEASLWSSVGFKPEAYARWQNSSLEFATEWHQNGFSSESETAPWVSAGFTASESRTWINESGFSADRAKDWKDYEFSPRTAYLWDHSGIQPHRANQWISAGQDNPMEVVIVDRVVDSLDDVIQQLTSGISLQEIIESLDQSSGDIGMAD
jgi:hypothetical protein